MLAPSQITTKKRLRQLYEFLQPVPVLDVSGRPGDVAPVVAPVQLDGGRYSALAQPDE
jgi:hypothetical protein